jgi:methionyl-tRNA synthetase
LQDVSISRLKTSVGWGIPVPDDQAHTLYIWFDALTNYITALGWGSEQRRREFGPERFERFWPGVHLLGKDILRQHAVLWPAMLLAAGVEQPRAVISHGMWVDAQGRKFSKTLGNSIDIGVPLRYTSADAMRYVLLREKSFGGDGRLGYELIFDRVNSDLASGLGNLVARTLTMIGRYFDGRVPAPEIPEAKRLLAKRSGVDTDALELSSSLELARDQFVQAMQTYEFNRALEAVWGMIARADKFISDAKPWELAKSEELREVNGAVLYRAAETIRWLAVLLYPVMPASCAAVARQLGLEVELKDSDPAQLKWGGLGEGTRIGEVAPLFPRVDKKKVMAEIMSETEKQQQQRAATDETSAGAHATQAAVPGAPTATEAKPAQPPQQGATEAAAVPGAPEHSAGGAATPEGVVTHITIEDFVKVEMRVGEILTAERVPKSDKLLRFTVDLGEAAPRQILAGIAEHYEPEKLIGRKVAVVSNLKPRKLRGFESQGMVLAASVGEEGCPVLATFTEDVPNGARLK